jgi:hypothetical protein
MGRRTIYLVSWSPADLPNLHAHNHTITSPAATRYNCIAWAAGSVSQWWWPIGRYFWPPNVPREETLDAFIRAYGTLGFIECADDSAEPGIEKIALYAVRHSDGTLLPTHAARQLLNGAWTSKLGPLEDIEHASPQDVSGPCYGEPVRFLRRPVT